MLKKPNRVTDIKSNCVNTISKFYHPSIEAVEKLNYYDPEFIKDSLVSCNKSSSKKFAIDKKDKSIVTSLNLPHLINNIHILADKESERSWKSTRQENQKIENDLESKRRLLQIKINEKKQERSHLILQISSLEKEINDINLDLELINTYGKNININPTYENNQKVVENKKKICNRQGERKSMLANIFKLVIQRKDEELDSKNSNLDRAKTKKFYLKEDLKLCEIELRNLKKEQRRLINQLLTHYHKILNEGNDTRQEGLTWVIKAINNLGSKVILSSLPNFLDENAIKYLFTYCFWEIEFSKLKEERLKIKNEFKKVHEKGQDEKNKMNSTFKTLLDGKGQETQNEQENGFFSPKIKVINQNAYSSCYFSNNDNISRLNPNTTRKNFESRFFNIYSNEKLETMKDFNSKGINVKNTNLESHLNMNMDKLCIKNVEDYLVSKDKIDVGSNIILKDLIDVDNKINKMKAHMSNMRRNEMNRLMKEFNTNDYERRYKTTKFAVISALVGEENTQNEINRQNREQKNFSERIKQCRSFNVFEKNDNLKSNDSKINPLNIYESLKNSFIQKDQIANFNSNSYTKNKMTTNFNFSNITNTNFKYSSTKNSLNNTKGFFEDSSMKNLVTKYGNMNTHN